MKACIFAVEYFCHPHYCIFLVCWVNSVHLNKRKPLYSAPLYRPLFPPCCLWLLTDWPFLITRSSCWGWYCPFHSARTYTVKTTPKCPSLEFADSRAMAPQRKEQTEHSCLAPRLSNHWPLFLWHPISDTTLLRTIRIAIQPDLLAIGPLGYLHPASGLFLLHEAELNCLTSHETPD